MKPTKQTEPMEEAYKQLSGEPAQDAVSASVTSSSTTLCGGTYSLSLTKTSDFAIKVTGTFTATDASV